MIPAATAPLRHRVEQVRRPRHPRQPPYTGHQVRDKQRKDEVLIDVEDVALGHTTKLRWNDAGKWPWSEKIVQPPIIDRETFDQVRAMVAGRAVKHAEHKPHRHTHPYALRGLVVCGLGERRMQSHWVNGEPYYRCRFPAEYALANHVEHPLNVNLREDAIIGHVDAWLAREFAPHRIEQTIRDLAEGQVPKPESEPDNDDIAIKIAECDRKLAQYKAVLDAAGSSATDATWIAETEAKKATYVLTIRRLQPRRHMTEVEIRALVDRFAAIATVRRDADPDDKADVFRQLGLKLTYRPGRRLVEAEINIPAHSYSESV
jgi:hypothetical protein